MERRRFLTYALAGAAAAMRVPRVWAAPAKTPPAPGSPPDKQNASGVTVKPEDPSIRAGALEFPGSTATLQGYLAAPVGGETYPAILLLHDENGFSEHTRDVARRLAKLGYVALAPDLLSRFGGSAKEGTPAKITATMARIPIQQFIQDGNSAVRYLEIHPLVAKSRIGTLGFGLGGLFSWFLAADNSDLKVSVMCYGGVPNLQLIPRITGSVLAIYGDTDGHDADELKDLDAAMKKTGQPWNYKIEAKAGRGFFDDTRKSYAADAAKDAWKMSLDWYTSRLPR